MLLIDRKRLSISIFTKSNPSFTSSSCFKKGKEKPPESREISPRKNHSDVIEMQPEVENFQTPSHDCNVPPQS